MKKRRKIDVLNVLGVLLIIVGLSIFAYDYGTRFFERQSQQKELTDFLNAPLLSEGDDFEKPSEGSDVDRWGTIKIDKLGVNHIIAKSNDWSLLNRYVVAWEKSPNPPEKGNFAIAGHNGNCASCVFRDFDKLENGDTVQLTHGKDVFTYKITKIYIVEATDLSVLDDTPNESTLTLVTCKDQITNDPYRLIVKATLVENA